MFISISVSVLNPIVLKDNEFISGIYFTSTNVVFPTPTFRFGETFKSIKSPDVRLWEVDIETVVRFWYTVEISSLYVDSK